MTDTTTIDQLRQRMIEDMSARDLGPASQKSSLRAYKRFATWLRRSPDTAMAEDFRLFQLHLAEGAVGTVTRNATMTGHRFLFRPICVDMIWPPRSSTSRSSRRFR